jgi:hypothetical protein
MQPATVTAASNPSSINPLQGFTVTANVAGANGQAAPTGGVGFYADGPGGSWSASGTLVNGMASFSYPGSYWSPGTIYVDVAYSGDTVYAPVDVVVPVTVGVPFTITTTPVTIAVGATTGNTSTITVTPGSGFTGPVYFSCTLEYYPPGAQHLPTCGVPISVNVPDANPVTTAMAIATTAPTTTALNSRPSRLRWIGAEMGTVLAGLLLAGIPSRRRGRNRVLGVLVVLMLLASLMACGGGSTMGGGGGKTVPGTTPGTYKFMVESSFTASIGSSVPQVNLVTVTIQ